MSRRFLFLTAVLLASQSNVVAQRALLTGGGDVTIRREGDLLFVSVEGPRAGLASLCVGDDSQVRILHASAALGEALYEKHGSDWVLRRGFDWRLRDDPRTGAPGTDERNAFFSETGWIANASRVEMSTREFKILLTEHIKNFAVTFLTTTDPMTVSYWPATVDDSCRMPTIAKGFLPQTAQFRPGTWSRAHQ